MYIHTCCMNIEQNRLYIHVHMLLEYRTEYYTVAGMGMVPSRAVWGRCMNESGYIARCNTVYIWLSTLSMLECRGTHIPEEVQCLLTGLCTYCKNYCET